MVLLMMNRAAETWKCPGVEVDEVFISINKTTFTNEPRPSEISIKGAAPIAVESEESFVSQRIFYAEFDLFT